MPHSDGGRAPAAHAYGYTFVLAPSLCLKVGREDALNFGVATQHEGLAFIIQSDMRSTDRVHELVEAELGSPADALLSADQLLGPDAVRLLSEPNAGGASRVSEAMSMEVLNRAFGATLLQTELEITYWPSQGSPITDFSVLVDGTPLGVSVTRALGPPNVEFDTSAARALLIKKLHGVVRSTETCLGAWRKQILHVWAPTATAAAALESAYATLPSEMVSDTVVLITTCTTLPCLFFERMSKSVERVKRPLKGAKDAHHLLALAESDPCRTNRR